MGKNKEQGGSSGVRGGVGGQPRPALRAMVPLFRRVLAVGFSFTLASQRPTWAQTYVQVGELDPNHPIGARITSTVTNANLSRTLFGSLGEKVTAIDALDFSPPVALEFATDGAWNRLLFGQKDVYINAFNNSGSGQTPLQGPVGVDVSNVFMVHIADVFNGRVVLAEFVPTGNCKGMYQIAVTPTDTVLRGVVDVAWDGGPTPEGAVTDLFYAVDLDGYVSYWSMQPGTRSPAPPCPGGYSWPVPPARQWTYGSSGSGTGQFRDPRGVCVGHAIGANGTAAFTNDFYVADFGNHRVVWLQRTTSGANWMGVVSLPSGGMPADCTVDEFGNVTVADVHNSRLWKYTWNLQYLDNYGTYGVGATNDNTFAHPHTVHVPYGTTHNAANQVIWYGEGRVITGEDWGAQSGAREHYLGIKSTITAQPYTVPSTGHWDFTYNVTDHANHQGVTIIDGNGNLVRSGLAPTGLQPPGSYTADWDGTNNNGYVVLNGSYRFQVRVVSAYGCSGSSWCDQTLTSSAFSWTGGPPLLSATISGPTDITQAGTYTWTANPTGGTGTYIYSWQYRDAFNQNWVAAGSGRSVSKSVSTSTASWFDYKVTVSSGIQSTQPSVHVISELGTCNPNC